MKRTNALVAFAGVALLSGCMAGGAMVKKDGLAATSKIAVVSVVMPRIADTAKETNRTVLQNAVERTLLQAEAGLKTMRPWTVVESAGYKGSPAVTSVSAISDPEIESLFSKGDDGKTARETVAGELSRWKAGFIGPKGLPVVPHDGLVPIKGERAQGVLPLMQQRAAKLCNALNVDAVVFVHIYATISHPRAKTFIVSNNRTDGTLRAAQTMVIVDRTGQVIADMGTPALDERARSRDLLPLYVGSGESAVRQENIDLGDPRNKIQHAFLSLMEETAGDLIARLKKATGMN